MEVRNNSRGRTAVRYLGQNRTALGKTLEKLSSGYRINRAADDAAGLAISEKMRLQITGTGRAYENSREGVGLIKTGEGALEEIHAMLDRAAYLAEQSANGTYQDELDRESLQKELEQLCSEIDRIATSANFNGIELFQDRGYPYEGSTAETLRAAAKKQAETRQETVVQQQKSAETAPQEKTAEFAEQPVQEPKEPTTLEELLERQEKGNINIVYVERTDFVQTIQSNPPDSTSTLSSDITLADGRKLSDVLKTEIIPNTVNNIIKSYPAFSYLNGSNIGIGLEYFSGNATGKPNTLAYVSGQVGSSGSSNGTNIISREDFITYTLGVNTDNLAAKLQTPAGRSDLEATIAHEMIHAFMDEATTSGMFGRVEGTGTNLTASATKFPDWFVEGMAQTASGPGNWLKTNGLNISQNSTDADITTAIQNNRLGTGTSESQYGTGYLACMYLGAVISGGGMPSSTADAVTISQGLSRLMNEIIGGKSLNDAISSLTNGKFTGSSDFETKFNAGSAEIGNFVRGLLTATGSGLGGIVSGDLSASDLTPDTNLGSTVGLFQLDPSNNKVQNVYPDGYKVYSGGTTDATGTAPTGFSTNDPVLPRQDFDDLVVSGAKASDIEYDANTHVLKVKTGANIVISMKNPGNVSSLNKIILDGVSNVTLNGVQLSDNNALTITDNSNNAKVTYEGENSFGGIKLDNNVDASFAGTGQLKTGTFSSDNTNNITFEGGAVIVGNGTGAINGNVTVTGASAAAAITPAPTDASGNTLESIEFPWDKLGSNVASVQIGGATYKMALDNTDPAKLWLDPNTPSQKVIFTDSSGKKITRTATYNVGAGKFEWAAPARPFTVSGTEGTDWYYEDDETLVIQSSTPLTISGGSIQDADGNTIKGRIKLADNISGTVNLTLNGVSSTVSTGSAFDLGKNNNVTINLADGTDNSFTSGENYAGISLGDGTNLTINGGNAATNPNAGTLTANGGRYGAGIGRNGQKADGGSTKDQSCSVTINGGNITAAGGYYGAGIGAGDSTYFGDITISGGNILANGGLGGAGIGGANNAAVGDIAISGGVINAESAGHGAGIGGGWGSTADNGTITIQDSDVTAKSLQHGTGIGAGCQADSGLITIISGTIDATGGEDGAGIGASWIGSCAGINIKGGDITATGGNNGAGIGSGSEGSRVTSIVIDTTGTVTATGGQNGVGIGSGRNNSSCGNIDIKQGTVSAQGSTDATGIGAGRGSTSGNITIGDTARPDSKVIVDAKGGMTNNGGNIMSYTDGSHTTAGTVTVTGNGTSIRPGEAGEGLYSTSGSEDESGNKVYAYPVYLFESTPPLDAGEGLDPDLPLPAGATDIQITATGADGSTKTWAQGLSHEPFDSSYVFVWMSGQDQTVDIEYKDAVGILSKASLALKFYPDSGVFRVASQPVPPPAKKPEYITNPPTPPAPPPTQPDTPTPPLPAEPGQTGKGGIILQIGANFGEILEVPTFYLSRKALGLDKVDISTQQNAWDSMPVIKNAINRVSDIRGTYGALQNRLEHNMNDLSQSTENLTDAESRIRDADMAQEYANQVRLSISMQAAQAMLAQSNQNASQVLQLLQ